MTVGRERRVYMSVTHPYPKSRTPKDSSRSSLRNSPRGLSLSDSSAGCHQRHVVMRRLTDINNVQSNYVIGLERVHCGNGDSHWLLSVSVLLQSINR